MGVEWSDPRWGMCGWPPSDVEQVNRHGFARTCRTCSPTPGTLNFGVQRHTLPNNQENPTGGMAQWGRLATAGSLRSTRQNNLDGAQGEMNLKDAVRPCADTTNPHFRATTLPEAMGARPLRSGTDDPCWLVESTGRMIALAAQQRAEASLIMPAPAQLCKWRLGATFGGAAARRRACCGPLR